MKLPTVDVHGLPASLHNYYEPTRFFHRDEFGNLVDRHRERLMLMTEDLLVGFQVGLEAEVGDAAGEIMYRCGFAWGQEDIAGFERRFPDEFGRSLTEAKFGMMLETWWWPLQAAGWGAWRYDLSHRKEGLIFVDLFDSAVARSLGNVGKVVCHYYAGMFAAAFAHLSHRELSAIEIQCYSMGEDHCKFLIGSSKRINAAQFWVSEGAKASEIIARL